ncbi:YiiG family protein [Pseudomonas sp. B21-028]|uniref:YiiG family protein n=1 Tax=Pseudomonas sp. B21-028 TaxID=2895480 RepID=UPI00215EF2EB|nr:YiiG family protein [Pseudomonas sp. B21-028]UVL86451.1 YiiG family protein [Pseudomonas sp. B21-028]
MISSRAFATAVLVSLGLSWLVKQIDPVHIDYGTRLRWQAVQQINTCLVDGADLLEQRYSVYHSLVAQSQKNNEPWRGFAGFGMGSGDVIPPQGAQPSPCYRWFGGGDPGSLQYLAKNYLGAYDNLRPSAEAAERWLATRVPDRPPFEPIERALNLRLQDARDQAIPLRQALEQPQILVRQEQLASIEERLGHDQHWYTLRFMIHARQTINALDAMANGASLTPQQLSSLHRSLANSWSDADAFVKARPRLRSANDGQPVWSQISLTAEQWLAALNRLQQHWVSGADAAELNQDLAAARAGYDELQSLYNLVAKQY